MDKIMTNYDTSGEISECPYGPVLDLWRIEAVKKAKNRLKGAIVDVPRGRQLPRLDGIHLQNQINESIRRS